MDIFFFGNIITITDYDYPIPVMIFFFPSCWSNYVVVDVLSTLFPKFMIGYQMRRAPSL